MALEAELVFKLHVRCSDMLTVGSVSDGCLRVIPIIGGTFEGRISGEVISGGADWNTLRPDGSTHVFAKYLIKTNDGCFIGVENEGVMPAGEGNAVKTNPRFQADANGPYAWLNSGVFVGTLCGGTQPGEVEIGIYSMK